MLATHMRQSTPLWDAAPAAGMLALGLEDIRLNANIAPAGDCVTDRCLARNGQRPQKLRVASAASTRAGVNGACRRRTPVASKTALPMADATSVMVHSP